MLGDSLSGQEKSWSAFISFRPVGVSERVCNCYNLSNADAHNIPMPSSPLSPHPLATVSSSGAPFSTTALSPLVATPPISGAGCADGAASEYPAEYHETSTRPTVGRLVPLAWPCCNPSH